MINAASQLADENINGSFFLSSIQRRDTAISDKKKRVDVHTLPLTPREGQHRDAARAAVGEEAGRGEPGWCLGRALV